MEVPFVDLKAQYLQIKPEMDEVIARTVENTDFIKGPALAGFEAAFAECLGVPSSHVIGCSNGTSSVTMALRAAGVKPGDEVIVTSHTFFATIESVVHLGAIPVFVDINACDYTLSAAAVAEAVTTKTRAIVAVHIYGTPCDMGALQKITNEKNLLLIEDCAQAHFATWQGQYVSTFGDAAGFSFYPGKNLGAYGDAGAFVVKDAKAAETARKYIDHGRLDKYQHSLVGDNLRMDSLQAAILTVKMRYIMDWTKARQQRALIYDETLKAKGFKVIEHSAEARGVYHLYIVEVSNRDEVQKRLAEKQISTGVHYPVPCHAQPAMKEVSHRVTGDMSVTDQMANRILSLPIFPELTREQQEYVMCEFLKVAIG